MTPTEFEALVTALEMEPAFSGKLVADIPELAAPRLAWRRRSYRFANGAFGLTIFNLWLATSPQYGLWWLSALSVGLMTWLLWWCEGQARAMTRQLKRRAAVQLARDLAGFDQ